MPSLRECREDIPLLARHILDKLSRASGVRPPVLAEAALRRLQTYPFPGNARELENILERALAMSDGGQLDVADLVLPAKYPSDASTAETLQDKLDHFERELILGALKATNNNRTAAARLLGVTFAPALPVDATGDRRVTSVGEQAVDDGWLPGCGAFLAERR